MNHTAALSGLKVLEITQVIAGTVAGSFLADLGADVIHVEDPVHGDPHRDSGVKKDSVPLWWKVSARNKRCVTLDLRSEEGQALARRMSQWADVVITNFRASTLERWGLDWPSLHAVNPRLVMLQITGFGAAGSQRDRPGFGKVGEAMSGVVYLTGFPDGPPVHTGFSHADSVTGLAGAFAVQAALYRRSVDPEFDGEWIDLALFEPLYRLIEWQVIVYDQLGLLPGRAGNQLAIGPAAVINTYQSSDGHWITVTTGTTRAVRHVAELLGEPLEDYATVDMQRDRRDRLDGLLRVWIAGHTAEEILAATERAGVTASRVFSVVDILEDPTYAELGDVVTVEDADLGPVRMQGVIPRLSEHPGHVWRTGAGLGEDNDVVYGEWLGLGEDEVRRLRDAGTI